MPLPTPIEPTADANAVIASLRETCAFMTLAREWDLRFERMFRQGGVSKWYSSVGNEAVTVAAASELGRGDALVTLHRDNGAWLRYYLESPLVFPVLVANVRSGRGGYAMELLYRAVCLLIGKRDGFSGGYERSYHYAYEDEAAGIVHVGMISHLGAMIPVSAGLGFGFQRRGSDRVALNFIGDGGTSTGDFHEGLNMAAVLRCPLILLVENNRFAFSTPVSQQYAAESIASRAEGYGIPGVRVDGNDPEAVGLAVRQAVARARDGHGPTLIEAMLGRMRGHSEGDRSLDRVPEKDLADYIDSDPVAAFNAKLLEQGMVDQRWLDEVQQRASEFVLEAVDRAVMSADPDPQSPRAVFAPLGEVPAPRVPAIAAEEEEVDGTYLEAISSAMRDSMREDESVLLLGQDIAEFGGAFTATRGFVEEFGAERVVNTPIAESGTIGIAAGASLRGLRPIVEIQFADFVSCGFNQLANVAAKFFYRCEMPIPIVVRLPSGGGVAAGAFHSQNVEAWFLHVPGLKVVAPSSPYDAYKLLREAIRDPNPVLFIEHKFLYRRVEGEIPTASSDDIGAGVEPVANVVREGTDATVVAWGWMVHRGLEAAESLAKKGLSIEIVDLAVLSPLEESTILESIDKTGRALVVYEAPFTGGFGGEIAARIADLAFESLDAPVRRLGYADTPVPFHKDLEAEAIPCPEKIAAALEELCRY